MLFAELNHQFFETSRIDLKPFITIFNQIQLLKNFKKNFPLFNRLLHLYGFLLLKSLQEEGCLQFSRKIEMLKRSYREQLSLIWPVLSKNV